VATAAHGLSSFSFYSASVAVTTAITWQTTTVAAAATAAVRTTVAAKAIIP